MMKPLMMLALAALLIGCDAAKKDQFQLTGTISSYPGEVLIISYVDGEDFQFDTIRVENGHLNYQKSLTDTVMASIVSRDANNNIHLERGLIPGESIPIFMAPGTRLEVTLDNTLWPEIQMKGDALNEDLMKLYAIAMPLKRQAFDLLRQAMAPGVDEETKVRLERQRAALRQEAEEATVRFVKDNPASYAALQLLGGLRNSMSLEAYATTFERVPAALQRTRVGQEIEGYIRLALATAVGATAPDFAKQDKEGKTVRLSDYRGKYVLLDFWGSWCGPCRVSHPHLKEIHAKYAASGLEIINIAQENGRNIRETWLKAIEEDGMTWTQILNNEGKEACDVVSLFGVTAFPTKVLIDPQGKIIARCVGDVAEIDVKLQEAFGK